MQKYDRDQDHLTILGIVYYVNAGLTAFFALFGLIYVAMGLAMLGGALPVGKEQSAEELQTVGIIVTAVGGGVCGFLFLLALMNYLCGRWLSAGRNRTFCFVCAILTLLSVPYGTLLGIFTIIVLSRDSVIARFRGEPYDGDGPSGAITSPSLRG